MTAWFEEFPLKFDRRDTREAEDVILLAYNTNDKLIRLAENSGLNLSILPLTSNARTLLREMLQAAALAERLTTLIAQVYFDTDNAAARRRLEPLSKGREAAIEAAYYRSDPSIAKIALLPPALDVWSGQDATPAPALEKTINQIASFFEADTFLQRIAEARVRTARIEVGGAAEGTGFLVAPDLLMTNWHVARLVADGRRGAARFDHSAVLDGRVVPFADEWLVAHSEPDDETIELRSDDGPELGKWDFAIVRLAEPVGGQAIGPDPDSAKADLRGHFQLEWLPHEFNDLEPLLIVGHPKGNPTVQLSIASPSRARATKHGNRVRYDTNTEGGSSGSPVFGKELRIVALHHASGKTIGTGVFNQGVPISGIGDELRKQLAGKPELEALGLV